uniref:Uncharacterized protein n=1 Tax=Oryza nivara TaxID=4536 RepID=A0A0E0FYJ0_ORYNI
MDRDEHHARLCPASRVASAQAEVQRRRLSWCCARKAATHHPPSVPSHGLNNTSFFKGMMLANHDIGSTELSTLHCTSGVDAKRLQAKKQRDANCATKNLFGGQTGKASDILVEHANRKEKLSWTCSCGLW